MEVLFEYRGSRRALTVADSENVAGVVGNELRRVGKPRASVFTANDELPSRQRVQPDIYLLQKWSTQWDCYVDVVHCNEICDGDRLAVIAKPKPSSKIFLLCCCGSDSSYTLGKVGESGKHKVPKTEEIQSLEYRFRVESEEGPPEWEEEPLGTPENQNNCSKEGVQYIRTDSGRAAWKLVKSSPCSGDSPTQIEAPEGSCGSGKEGESEVGRGEEGESEVGRGEESEEERENIGEECVGDGSQRDGQSSEDNQKVTAGEGKGGGKGEESHTRTVEEVKRPNDEKIHESPKPITDHSTTSSQKSDEQLETHEGDKIDTTDIDDEVASSE